MTEKPITTQLFPVIIRDTREKAGYHFFDIHPDIRVIEDTLNTGDYSIMGYEDEITIERKSLEDAYNTFGKGRVRFENELNRMKDYKFAAVMIEADWSTILRSPPFRSAMNPKAVYASVLAWVQRYRVHFFTCPNRAFSERTTYRLLERFWIDAIGHNTVTKRNAMLVPNEIITQKKHKNLITKLRQTSGASDKVVQPNVITYCVMCRRIIAAREACYRKNNQYFFHAKCYADLYSDPIAIEQRGSRRG